MKIITGEDSGNNIVVFNDLPRMSIEYTTNVVDYFRNVFKCDVCIISGENERYDEGFKYPVNYVKWDFGVDEEKLIYYNVIHLWKHYLSCQLLPQYTNFIKARSDIEISKDIDMNYWNSLVRSAWSQNWTLGFGDLSSGKVLLNMRRKTQDAPIHWMSDYVISHKREHLCDPNEVVWTFFEDEPDWTIAKERCNAHHAWTHMFGRRKEIENVLFPIRRVENIDNKEFGRIDDER